MSYQYEKVTSDKNAKPLITFALFSYNQEEFIKEAIEAAFTQTYGNLQIILSDDHSSDKTYQIIEELTASYVGPHKVILNRNKQNLGLGAHINKITQMAAGELIVVAAGDDISLPGRTQTLVDAWLQDGKRKASMCSDAVLINPVSVEIGYSNGKPLNGSIEDGIKAFFSGLQGATHAWRKDVFNVFGDMLADTICEDRVIPMRAAFLGGVGYVAAPLVKYRIHTKNISHHTSISVDKIMSRTIEIHRRNSNILANYCHDLLIAKKLELIGGMEFDNLMNLSESLRCNVEDKIKFLESGLAGKMRLIGKYLLTHPAQAGRWAVILLLPMVYLRSQEKNLGVR